MAQWLVRQEGAPRATALPSAEAVMAGLRDGVWQPTDEVKGPDDPAFVALDAHPLFEEVAGDLEEPLPEGADDTHLDMNPLIDVCLVLLIFFILTISYASLERSISVPEDNPDDKSAKTPRVEMPEIKDKIFKVVARMEGDTVLVKLDADEVLREGVETLMDEGSGRMKAAKADIERKMADLIRATGRRVMLLDWDENVPWGIETAILDAAKGNKVNEIMMKSKKK